MSGLLFGGLSAHAGESNGKLWPAKLDDESVTSLGFGFLHLPPTWPGFRYCRQKPFSPSPKPLAQILLYYYSLPSSKALFVCP